MYLCSSLEAMQTDPNNAALTLTALSWLLFRSNSQVNKCKKREKKAIE